MILCIFLSVVLVPAHAQITSEFGYKLHPEKLLENTEGTLQVFVISNELMVPKGIGEIQVVSSDNEVIQILGVEEGENSFTKNVFLKAVNPGISSVILAAPGFSSKEITLEVFNNNNYPTRILMKVTPEEFPVDGQRYGHVSVALATTGGIPTVASDDILISLDTPNKDVIKIKDPELTISNGEYFAITEFEIIGSGDAIIFAETEGMNKISNLVKILEPKKPLALELSVFPESFNSFSGTTGFAIIQLMDGEGIPVIAEEDINFKINVENPDTSINTSHDFEEVYFDQQELTIEKGSYSTYTKFSPRPNIGDFTDEFEQVYNMYIQAEDYLTEGDSFLITHDQIGGLEGKGPSITETVPFLTTGKQEIIGVTYYETEIEVARQSGIKLEGTEQRILTTVTVPVRATEDHELNISSSELGTINPINPSMNKGDNAVLIFGNTGTIVPEASVKLYVTDNEGVKTISTVPIGPIEEDLSLIVEPLVPMILAEHEFPIVAYLNEEEEADEEGSATSSSTTSDEEEDEDPRLGVTPFIEDEVLTFSANKFVEVNSITVKQNQPYVTTNVMSNEVGTSSLEYQMGTFSGTTPIQSHTTDPAKIHLSYPENILADSSTLATVQLLDTTGNPVYAKNDIEVKLVSNNEDVLKIPNNLTVKSGEYFTTFNLDSKKEGIIELSLLSEDYALSKYTINVVDIKPVLALNLVGSMNWNERIEAKLGVTIPQIETSLSGFQVKWTTEGGEVRSIEETTNDEGIATLNIIANDQETITITAAVSGNGLSDSTISKTVDIQNMPVVDETTVTQTGSESIIGMPFDENMIILIIIPVAIVGALFFLKRTEKLEVITEKIPILENLNIGDKIEEVKEKISDIRNR